MISPFCKYRQRRGGGGVFKIRRHPCNKLPFSQCTEKIHPSTSLSPNNNLAPTTSPLPIRRKSRSLLGHTLPGPPIARPNTELMKNGAISSLPARRFSRLPGKKGRLIASDSNDHHRVTRHTLESVIYWGQCWRFQRFSIIPTEI